MSDILNFRDAFHAVGLSSSNRRRYANLAPGYTQWVKCQGVGGSNLLAICFEGSVALSASASQSAVANSDLLDEIVSGQEIAPLGQVNPRIKCTDRFGVEELERLVLDTSERVSGTADGNIGSYQRATPVAFTASGTRTDTMSWVCPVGGPACSARVQIPSITSSFAADVTVTSYTLAWFEIYSDYGGVVAAQQVSTGDIGSGNQDITDTLDKAASNLAPDLIDFIGITTSTNGLNQIFVTGQAGDMFINCDSAQAITSLQGVYPNFATTEPTYNALVFQLYKKRWTQVRINVVTASTSFNILLIQVQASQNSVPSNVPAATPQPPAVANVGTKDPTQGPTSPSTAAVQARTLPSSARMPG